MSKLEGEDDVEEDREQRHKSDGGQRCHDQEKKELMEPHTSEGIEEGGREIQNIIQVHPVKGESLRHHQEHPVQLVHMVIR